MSSPPAPPAICGRATACRARARCIRATARFSRQPICCRRTAAPSRPTTCTKAGATTSIGTPSWIRFDLRFHHGDTENTEKNRPLCHPGEGRDPFPRWAPAGACPRAGRRPDPWAGVTSLWCGSKKSAAVAVMLGAIATAVPSLAEEEPKRGGTLTYMIPADGPPSFDGHREATYATVHSAAPYYSVLIRVDPNNPDTATDFVCDLCTEVPQPTDSGKTYSFKIRDGVKFHD